MALFERERGPRRVFDFTRIVFVVMVIGVVFSLAAIQQLTHLKRSHMEKETTIAALEKERDTHKDSVHQHRKAVDHLRAKLDSVHANLTQHAGMVAKLQRERDAAVGEDVVRTEAKLKRTIEEHHQTRFELTRKETQHSECREELALLKKECSRGG
mmetsp:Transcript_61933/g.195748  ORF Transcript_61933/g.195748 Transcript_61933/m.195748 type:complete len:156 (-) Transcript_61933:1509-1976(-)